MDENIANQTPLPTQNQRNFQPFYQQPVILNSQNQLYLAFPLDNLNMLNGSGIPPNIQKTIAQHQNLWNYPREPFIKEQYIQHPFIHDNQQFKDKIPQIERQAPKTNFKVRYFDCNTAPLMTSSKYYTINDPIEKVVQQKYDNQLTYPQEDSNQFILFKNRRLKKKFKCYMSQQDQRIFNLNFANESGQDQQGEQGIELQNEVQQKNSQQFSDQDNRWNPQRLRYRKKQKKSKNAPCLYSSNDQKDSEQSFKCEEI